MIINNKNIYIAQREPNSDQSINRVLIIGSAGSGKTTLAFKLATKTGIPAVDLDSLNFEPGTNGVVKKDFVESTDRESAKKSWIISGCQPEVQDMLVKRADSIIWLDFSLSRIFKQVVDRTHSRAVVKDQKARKDFLNYTASRAASWLCKFFTRKAAYSKIARNPRAYPNIKVFARVKNHRQKDRALWAFTNNKAQ